MGIAAMRKVKKAVVITYLCHFLQGVQKRRWLPHSIRSYTALSIKYREGTVSIGAAQTVECTARQSMSRLCKPSPSVSAPDRNSVKKNRRVALCVHLKQCVFCARFIFVICGKVDGPAGPSKTSVLVEVFLQRFPGNRRVFIAYPPSRHQSNASSSTSGPRLDRCVGWNTVRGTSGWARTTSRRGCVA
jgi:hypothetical protein